MKKHDIREGDFFIRRGPSIKRLYGSERDLWIKKYFTIDESD